MPEPTYIPRVLVVGASGQLGAELLRQLGPSALPAGRTLGGEDWVHLDLEQAAASPATLTAIFDRHNISAVYCAAGATNVERCESDPAWATAANHTGPAMLARAARDIPFVFFSTDYVFDGGDNPGQVAGPYLEDAAPRPLSVYGQTKLAGERAVLETHPSPVIVRTTTVYGPDHQRKNFLYTLQRQLSRGQTMLVASDQFATPTYNEDLAAAAIALVERQVTGVFHVAGPDFLSRFDFALLACSLLHLDASLLQPASTKQLNQHAARPLMAGLRIDKLRALGGPAMRSPAEGIAAWVASAGAKAAR